MFQYVGFFWPLERENWPPYIFQVLGVESLSCRSFMNLWESDSYVFQANIYIYSYHNFDSFIPLNLALILYTIKFNSTSWYNLTVVKLQFNVTIPCLPVINSDFTIQHNDEIPRGLTFRAPQLSMNKWFSDVNRCSIGPLVARLSRRIISLLDSVFSVSSICTRVFYRSMDWVWNKVKLCTVALSETVFGPIKESLFPNHWLLINISHSFYRSLFVFLL